MAHDPKPRCFIAMPVTTHDHEAERYGDPLHWKHVMDSLFIKAIEAAGYEPVIPVAQGSHLIHEVIIKNLEECEMVLCDLSGHNPNVFFELGVRTSLNKPIALVKDERTDIPFDTSGINTYTYKSSLHGWDMETERESLQRHLEECEESCRAENPLWRKFGLTLKAQEPSTAESPVEAKLDLLLGRIAPLEKKISDDAHIMAILREENEELRTENMNLAKHHNAAERFRARADSTISSRHDGDRVDLFRNALSERLSIEFTGVQCSVKHIAPNKVAVSVVGPPDSDEKVLDRMERVARSYGLEMGLKVDFAYRYQTGSTSRALRSHGNPDADS